MFASEPDDAGLGSRFLVVSSGGGDAGGGVLGDEEFLGVSPKFGATFVSGSTNHRRLSDPIRTRIWGPPIIRGSG